MAIKNLIVGCGLTGAVIAERLANELGEESLVVDRRAHIGGNCYDSVDPVTGVIVHEYGPHAFHTKNKLIWDYLSRFTEWHFFQLKVKALIDGNLAPVPFNLNSLYALFPASLASELEASLVGTYGFGDRVSILDLMDSSNDALKRLGGYIHDKIFAGYTQEQWGMSAADVGKEVLDRVSINLARDDRYFQDSYQGIPVNGYTAMIAAMLENPLITVKLNTSYEQIASSVEWERLIFTGPIDEFFGWKLGALPYRSLRFENRVYPHINDFQKHPNINYPCNYDFTRSVEYCHYLPRNHQGTVVVYEYPQEYEPGRNEPFYPYTGAEERELYKRYAAMAPENIYFAGRLGSYRYLNMDQAVEGALETFAHIANSGNYGRRGSTP